MKLIDLTGTRFGRLVAVSYTGAGSGGAMWNCKCDCGAVVDIRSYDLRNSRTSCGCGSLSVSVGHRYGLLTVLSRAGSSRAGASLWLCLCDCGVKKTIKGGSLRSGQTTTCGCLRKPNLVGRAFGSWVVISAPRTGVRGQGTVRYWECVCCCGTVRYISTQSLTGGNSKSCGCARLRSREHKRRVQNRLDKEWRERNRDACLLRSRNYQRKPEVRERRRLRDRLRANQEARDIKAARARLYRAQNPERLRRYERSRNRNRNRNRITDAQWSEIFNASKPTKKPTQRKGK